MIVDRAPAVDSLRETGQELLNTADEDSRARIEQGLSEVSSLWQQLSDMVESRRKALEDAMKAGVQFDDVYSDGNNRIAALELELQSEELQRMAAPEFIQDQVEILKVLCYSSLICFSHTQGVVDLWSNKSVKLKVGF